MWDRILAKASEGAGGKLFGIDSTCAKVHKHGLCHRQCADNQYIARTRGGANTKVHAIVDARGRPIRIILSAGTTHDSLLAGELVERLTDRTILADKAYDTDAFRALLEESNLGACIPPKANRKNPAKYNKGYYKKRHHVENFFQKIKEFRAVATRYEKLDSRFRSFCVLASIIQWI